MYNITMAKKRTPEQEALSRAKKMPEKKGFIGWRMAWAWGDCPFKWGVFTDWTGITLDIGKAKDPLRAASDVPSAQFGFTFATKPFSIICFWRQKLLFWIGDWEWKKGLKPGA